MENIKTIIIDIREEFELLESYIKSIDNSLLIINIPSRVIFANKDWIKRASSNNLIYLICRSGNRTKNIKNKYFKNNKGIIPLDGGIKKIILNNLFKNKIKVIYGKGGFGLQQYIQFAFLIILTIILLLTYLNINKQYTLGLGFGFISFILYQIYNKGCLILSIIPLSEFSKN